MVHHKVRVMDHFLKNLTHNLQYLTHSLILNNKHTLVHQVHPTSLHILHHSSTQTSHSHLDTNLHKAIRLPHLVSILRILLSTLSIIAITSPQILC